MLTTYRTDHLKADIDVKKETTKYRHVRNWSDTQQR